MLAHRRAKAAGPHRRRGRHGRLRGKRPRHLPRRRQLIPGLKTHPRTDSRFTSSQHTRPWENQPASSNTSANSRRPRAARAHQGLEGVSPPHGGEETPQAGRALHGLRHPVLPHRHAHQRHGLRLPDQQPHPRVERPRLPRPLEGGARPPAQDEQLPRVHRPRLPRPVRRLLRARHQRPAGHDQEHRGPSSTRLGRRLGLPEPPKAHRQEGRRHRLRPRRPLRRRAAQQGRPHRHRLRARRPPRRPAHVWHPQHEARQKGGRPPPHQAAGDEGIKFICNANVGTGDITTEQIFLKDFDATVICTGATSRAISRSKAAAQGRALRHGLPHRQHQGRALPAATTSRQGQGRHRHRRRRHRHRLRRHLHAPRLQDRHADRNLPKPPLERAATIPGPNGPRPTRWTTARKRPPPSSAPIPASISPPQEVHRRRRRQREGSSPSRSSGRKNDKGSSARRKSRHRKDPPRAARPARHGLPRPEQALLKEIGLEPTPAATSKPSTRNTPPASRVSSPPATAAVARASSSGPSTKAAAPPASATAT
jgi:hypothetical protein